MELALHCVMFVKAEPVAPEVELVKLVKKAERITPTPTVKAMRSTVAIKGLRPFMFDINNLFLAP